MIRVPSGPQSGSETIDSAAFQFLGSSTASTSAPHFYLTNLVDTKRLLTFRADVNDAASLKNLAYLLRYDTAYGRYHRQIRADVDALVIDDRRIPVFAEKNPEALPWRELEVDLMLECTGVFTHLEHLTKHVQTSPVSIPAD